MIRRLPRWVWIGALVLSFTGGLVNAIGFVGLAHAAVSHVTGTVTQGAIAIAHGDSATVLAAMSLVAAFLAGAVISGTIIGNERLRIGRRYGVALIVESGLLFIAYHLFVTERAYGDLFAAAACGLQNAMVATYSGSVIRTTHLTGVTSDLGAWIGAYLRKRSGDVRQFALLATLFFGYATGAMAGAAVFARIAYHTLLLPVMLTLVTGVTYAIYRHLHPEIEPAT